MVRLSAPRPRRSLAAGATALALAASLCVPGNAWAGQDDRPKTVLLLLSAPSTSRVVATMETSLRRGLEAALGSTVELRVEYIDLFDPDNREYTGPLTALLAEKYAAYPIDVVVVQRAEGLGYLMANRAALFPGVPIVFVDVTPDEIQRLRLPPDVTGVPTPPTGQRTAALPLEVLPDTEHVFIVGGAGPSDRRVATLARQLVSAAAPGVDLVMLDGLPLADQLRRVAALPDRSAVIFSSYRADSLGRSMVSGDVVRRISRASRAPVFGSANGWLGDGGIIGGAMVPFEVMAQRAADLTVRLLKGEPVEAVAPLPAGQEAPVFDWQELRRWGIDEARLPAGSVVLFRQPTLWSQYKGRVLALAGVLAGLVLLVGALLVERRHRRLAQADLEDAELRYRTVADFTADWEYWTRPDGTLVYVSPSCLAITGYEASVFLAQPTLLTDIVVDEDKEKWREHLARATSSVGPRALEFRIRTLSGEVRWIDHVGTPVSASDGRHLGLRGSNRDVTARKAAEESLRRAVEENRELRDQLEIDNTYMREQLQPDLGIEGLIGTSDVMRYVISKVQQVAPTTSSVLLLGETGVGKSLIAQSIHNLGPRRHRPLVTLNCAALPPSLVESELFGHEKGAFTGALTSRRGRFEIANASTLFLDEIGDLPADLQAKLLRVVQTGEFERVGSNVTMTSDVRLIAATNRNLEDDVRAGRFRQDLWYRLNVFPITIPPLRQRGDDLPLLLNFFIEKHCRKLGRPVLQVSKATMKVLAAREWPGNVRELENVVERAVVSSRGPTLDLGDDLMVSSRTRADEPASAPHAITLEDVERAHIVSTLERLHWRVEGDEGAAALLGINPSTLRSRMRKLGVRRPGSAAVA